jgi:hypothetical protein
MFLCLLVVNLTAFVPEEIHGPSQFGIAEACISVVGSWLLSNEAKIYAATAYASFRETPLGRTLLGEEPPWRHWRAR